MTQQAQEYINYKRLCREFKVTRDTAIISMLLGIIIGMALMFVVLDSRISSVGKSMDGLVQEMVRE